jgi:hypothetical protein
MNFEFLELKKELARLEGEVLRTHMNTSFHVVRVYTRVQLEDTRISIFAMIHSHVPVVQLVDRP